jgi:phosphatidylglycerol---prolipoprotein diacylglyceryl transferase
MFPVIQIGPLALQAPGLIWLAGIWLGLLAAENHSKHSNLDANHIYNLVLIGLLAGILGARLGYVIQYFSIFSSNLLNIFSLTLTMLNIEAGAAVGMISAAIYGQRKRLPLWKTLDTLTPGLSIFMIFFHLANLASGEAFGTQAAIPWAIDLWGQLRHPVQIYELAASLLIAFSLWPRKNPASASGTLFWLFMALSSLSRLFFEFYRGDSTTILWNLHQSQVIAWLILAISMWQSGIRIHSTQADQNIIKSENN